MEKAAAGWNALLLLSCFGENVRMISSEFNNDKCSEHDAIAIISILFKKIQRGCSNTLHWVNVCWGTNAKPAHTNARAHIIFRCKIGWEGFYGKLLLNHAAVSSFSQSSNGTCKMIHDVSLLPKPHLQLPTHWSCVIAVRAWFSPREKTLLTHFFCDSTRAEPHQKSNMFRFLFLINIPLRVTVRIINLISLHIARHFINHC